ncbi:LysR family transcriptional regulator [Oceanicella actignis]|uniref:DNA-binding transcriptional regulator, LysR family n=1 Tax=Oceanicella actignis TaxID=1189325 RepID=A0A1M7TXC2_9RHOB|nr:LysR family transcriptional regulator [Oceanicella actignis]TYO89583.1 LysR family transcriptional regulator [Oceanicella actignis]SET79788.1 transcriptional regulator, LysR family [Oceanicella actignis]SHN75253.1 DNA-binding transcriptional regulator, LysR family [Oceanicella actignis]
MRRNLDLTALRSFVAVVDAGGVTRAAARLNLTQSAVSMQIKRLEESVGQPLLDRSGRGVTLTGQGELLLSYARRMVALNDEAWGRLTGQAYEGEVVLGVPSDIVYPSLPAALQRIAREYPRAKVTLVSSYTRRLRELLARGKADIILTTEGACGPGGETLARSALVWVGAPGGAAWRARPLRLAFENNCIFRAPVQAALDAAGIEWEMAVTSDSTRTIEATVSADLAVHAAVSDNIPPYFEEIRHGGALPDLPETLINLYLSPAARDSLTGRVAQIVREAYAARPGPAMAAAE